jgi:hypothetical protein
MGIALILAGIGMMLAGVIAQLSRIAKELEGSGYWRRAYENLVAQTGRDLNDGLGLDPRKVK